MWFYENDTVFVSLPGVPYEMKGLMTYEVLPRIQQEFKLPFIMHQTIMTYGAGESMIAERIEDFEDSLPATIKLAYLPSFGKVRLRLSANGPDQIKLKNQLKEKVDQLSKLIPDIIVGFEDDASIEKTVGQLLKEKKNTVATAECVTGGKIGARLVAIAGSSAYYKGSVVAYTAEMKKELLGVEKSTINTFSVVSEEVAVEMAVSVRKKMKSDYAIAVTGNAGPTTDDTDKTVGVVYIAIASDTGVFAKEFNFGQPREKVINGTVNKALGLLQKEILKKV